jgi:hypothetical protein
MTVMNAWPEDSPDWLYEHAVDELVANLGMYRRYRIEWLASHKCGRAYDIQAALA